MILVEIISWLFFAYLVYYLFYKLLIIVCSSKGHIQDILNRSYEPKYSQNISIVIYSHNNASGIIELIESLKKQEYEKEKYSINVILDNCTDNSSKLLEILGGCRIWRIKTDVGPIGKYKAYAWLMERIVTSETSNAYVFLSSDCLVKPDFLTNVNSAILDKSVIIGDTVPLNTYPDLITSLTCFKNKIRNRVNVHGRYYAGLANIIDSDVFAIKQNIAENFIYNITDNGFEEYEYSFKLALNDIVAAFCQDVQVLKKYSESLTSTRLDEYIKRYKKFISLKNNANVLLTKSPCLKAKELWLSLFYPSGIVFLFLLSILTFIKGNYKSLIFSDLISYKYILILLAAHFIVKLSELVVARSSFTDYKNAFLLFFFSPAILLLSSMEGFKIKLDLTRFFKRDKKVQTVNETEFDIIDATLTDGRKELKCQLELVKGENEHRINFIFREKKLPSSLHPRIDYALEEITNKLNEKGFFLKVCLNCGYCRFNEAIAANSNGEQGYCLYDNVNNESNSKDITYIWESCRRIIPPQSRKFVEDQLKNRK